MRAPTLWGLTVSPWSEKARWALDHHRIAYRYREHLPLLGEPALRWRARGRPPGAAATVPLLVDGRVRVPDSDAIARYAEARAAGRGSQPPLFAPELTPAIEAWERDFGAAMHAARVLLTQALLADPAAQVEMLPPIIPGPLRRPLRPVAVLGASFIARKHDAGPDQVGPATRVLTGYAQRLRSALARDPAAEPPARADPSAYIVGDRFSWADVCAAMIVNGFAGGVPGRFERWPASAGTWTRPELVHEFTDLVAWRDRIYRDHRPRSGQLD